MTRNDFVHRIEREKAEQFRHMSTRDKLRWLEETNAFINKVMGLEKRAQWDERFKVFLK